MTTTISVIFSPRASSLPSIRLAPAKGLDPSAVAAQAVPVTSEGIARASDGLPARLIKPHTREKLDRHGRYCGIFNGGMRKLWPDNRGYLELFAGPGRLIERYEELDGCPLLAARSDPPFNKLAFVEWNRELADALEQRLRARGLDEDRALVVAGDANDPDVLRQAMDFLPAPGLIFCFIDPEDINGHWDAIAFLASLRRWPKGQRVDFLVNVPVGPMKRNYREAPKISRVLGTEAWTERVAEGESLGPVFRETLAAQFKTIGYECAEHTVIRAVGTNAPVYDLVFASADERGVDFWRKIAAVSPSGQRTLDLDV